MPKHVGKSWPLNKNYYEKVKQNAPELVKPAFYATWFGLRLGYCPYLLFVFDRMMRASGAAPWDYTYTQVVGSHAFLCALNVWWTCEAVMGMRKKEPSKGA